MSTTTAAEMVTHSFKQTLESKALVNQELYYGGFMLTAKSNVHTAGDVSGSQQIH